MARPQSRFVCQSCGEAFLRWEGQCRACGGWNTLVETVVREPSRSQRVSLRAAAAAAAEPASLAGIADADLPRRSLGIAELDRVLGGGLVPGSLVLLGGEPGIGKSTLLLTGRRRPDPHLGRDRRGALCDRRGVARPGAPAGGPSGPARRAPRRRCAGAGRARRRSHRGGGAGRATRTGRRGFHPDRDGRRARGRGRQRRPGPRGDPPPDGPRQGRRDRGDPRRARDEGRLDRRARRHSSTSSTRSSTSKENATRHCGSCARQRTVSARPTRSASSRWARRACARSPIRPARSSPITAPPRRAASWPPPSRAAGRSSSRSRRSSARPGTGRHRARPAASIRTASACSSRCSAGELGSRSAATTSTPTWPVACRSWSRRSISR